MLHAPTSEAKTETTQSKSQLVPQPEQELHPRLLSAAGPYSLSGRGSVTSSVSLQVQRRQTLAGMQSTHGNQAVLRMLHSPQQVARMSTLRPSQGVMVQRKYACDQHTIAGAECSTCRSEQSTLHRSQRAFEPPSAPGAVPGSSPAQENRPSFNSAFDRASRFGHDYSQIPIDPPAAGVIQTKLAINKPGDQYEQEADRISEHVMRMPEPQLQRACACGGACPKCQTEQPGQENERLQTKRVGSSDLEQTAVPHIVHEVLASPGHRLDPAARAFMESRFGHDFSHVRVHADARAADSARALDALAYTVGRDTVFGAGRYAPGTAEGRRLLAHELAHTLQQAKGSAAGAERVSNPHDLAEQDADRAASDAMAGRQADVKKAANVGTLHRQPLPDVALRPPPHTARLIGSELLDGFALNSAALTEKHKERLAVLAHTLQSLLREYPGGSVQITGHTDATGEEKFNEQLGQQRADAVSDFLLKAGVPVTALASVSAGESKLRVKTDKPEPRNRRAEVRFEPKPKGRLFPSSELTPPPLPGPTTGSEGALPSSLAPERLCKVNPDLSFCRPGPEPSLPRGAEVAPLCTSTNCSAVSTWGFDKQPPDLQRVLAASSKDPATWLADPGASALTSIFTRMCSYGLWCHVRQVLKIDPAPSVRIAGASVTAPGQTPSVYFMSSAKNALYEAIMATRRFCRAYSLGEHEHFPQLSLREVSGSDSLHISIGPGDQFDAHIDRYSPVTEYPVSGLCPNDPSPAALGHILRELVPEMVHIPGLQVFPEEPPPPLGTLSSEPDLDSPRLSSGGTLVGVTVQWQPRKHREAKADLSVLSVEAVTQIDRAIEEQVSPDALLPSRMRVRLTEARKAADRAGPDEEATLRIARDAAEHEAANYPDAHAFARELAERMEQARRSHVAWVKIDLPQYDERDFNSRRAIARQIQRIALILRDYLPDQAADVHTVVIIFGSDNLATREEVKLP